TKEREPWSFHANLGYLKNENKIGEKKDIWHASLATEFEMSKGLELVGNIGMETNRDRSSKIPPAFILGGIVYSLLRNFDIDFGVKYGLTKTETDWTFLGGITLRF
ncbi:MAG: transporter, partial [Syntrophales bacterium LBB04]|nr:transporter [Syntrophales bacterium LBB04]